MLKTQEANTQVRQPTYMQKMRHASSLLWSADLTSQVENRQPRSSLSQDFASRTGCCCARYAAQVPAALQAALARHTAAMLFCWDGEQVPPCILVMPQVQ